MKSEIPTSDAPFEPSPARSPEGRGPSWGPFLLLALVMGLTAPLSLAACKDHSGHDHGEEGSAEAEGGSGAADPEDSAAGPSGEGDLAAARDAWDRALSNYHVDGGLDYAGLATDRGDLDAYLDFASQADPSDWSEDEQRAFWINSYNAVVASAVLREYPGIKSVQKVDGFFKRARHLIAGERRTLNEIEGEALALGDPRVHFAVVCASTGCPSLWGEAYRGSNLDGQLEDQTLAFLDDPEKGFRLEPEDDTIYLSKIFEWYDGDFGDDAVVWVIDHLPENLGARLTELKNAGGLKVEYIEYDWSLNDTPEAAG